MSERTRNAALSTLITLTILVAISSAAISYLWNIRGVVPVPEGQTVITQIALENSSNDTMRRVQDVMNAFKTPSGTRWSVVVEDLQTGARAETLPDESFTSASLYKLFVAYGAYSRADSQRLNLDATIGTESTTYEECIRVMIVISDNDCGFLLGRSIGWGNLDGQLAALGLTNTRVNNYQTDGTFEGNKNTAANDVVSFLARLNSGSLLTDESTARLLNHLKNQEIKDRIPSDLPADITIGHKTGNLEHIVHDAGFIFINNTPLYAYAIMTDGWKDDFPASAPPVFQTLLAQIIFVVTDQNQ